MEAKSEPTQPSAATAPAPAAANSCRKKKNEQADFLQDVKDHIDEFIHASMDEHKACFKNTMKKMFGMSKKVAEKEKSSPVQETESILALQTTVAK